MTDGNLGTAEQMLKARLDQWIAAGNNAGVRSYLVLDATWQTELAATVRAEGGWEPLLGLAGENRDQSHQRSPLIVDLNERPDIADPWLKEGFPARLGLIIFSRLDLGELRTRLKRFTSVMTPESPKPAYFRFYDARTLSCFLATGFTEQWSDFFEGIEMIAAPSDHAEGWSAFRFINGELNAGFETDLGADVEWKKLTGEGKQDEHYPAAFPFRRIAEPQYSQILACTRRLFHVEIAKFIAKALPEQVRDVSDGDLTAGIDRAHRRVDQLGHDSEDVVFYWAVLSFLYGDDFDQSPATASWLATEWLDIETKLEMLLMESGKAMNNQMLIDLADTMETRAEFADGTTAKWKTRTGRTI